MRCVACAAVVVFVAWPGLACAAKRGGGAAVPGGMWTEKQAESIRSVRGLRVHVRHCDGLGRGQTIGATIVYWRFACFASARIPPQPIDTVAITYMLHPLGPYTGRSSRYVLRNVHFGGLGVP